MNGLFTPALLRRLPPDGSDRNAQETKQQDGRIQERGGRQKSEQWSKTMHERLILPLPAADDSESRETKRHIDRPVAKRRQDASPYERPTDSLPVSFRAMDKQGNEMRSRSLLQQERKIYGPSSNQAPAKPLLQARQSTSKRPLQRLDPLERMQRIVTEQEAQIARNLEEDVDRMSQDIPIEFIMGRQHLAFAERIVLQAMCNTFHRYQARVRRAVFLHWKKRTLSLRILEAYERQQFVLRQTSLAHACAIVQRKVNMRIHVFLMYWRRLMLHLRLLEHHARARVIQGSWRKYALLMRLRSVVYAYRLQVRNNHAAVIQACIRRYLARCRFIRLVIEHQRNTAATRIQNCFRNYLVCQIAKRQKQRDAALVVQRLWRGYCGRKRARQRQNACFIAAEYAVGVLWMPAALHRAARRICMAERIQRCFRSFRTRRRVAIHFKINYRRRHFGPVSRIQQQWKLYHFHQVSVSVVQLVSHIEALWEQSATTIQRQFRRFSACRKQTAALTLTRVFRHFQAKREMVRRQSQWFQAWCEQYLNRWCKYLMDVGSSSHWMEFLLRHGQQVVSFKMEQLSSLERLCVSNGLSLVLSSRVLERDYKLARVQQIQCNWRWYRLRTLVQIYKQATLLLQRALPALFRSYMQRMRRRRVFSRWSRRRLLAMRDRFQQWKQEHLLIRQTKDLKLISDKLGRAKWFRHHKLRKSMINQWKQYVQQRRYSASRWQTAVAFSGTCLKRWVWEVWSKDVLPGLTAANRLHELQLIILTWESMLLHRNAQRKLHKAIAWHELHAKRKMWLNWRSDLKEYRRQLQLAVAFRDAQLQKQTLQAFRVRVALLKRVDKFRRASMYNRGVRQWVLHVCYARQSSAWDQQSRDFSSRQLKRRFIHEWIRYVQYQRRQRLCLQQMDRYHRRLQLVKSVTQWRERTPILKDLHCVESLAKLFREFKLKQFIFCKGLAPFWAQTIGARRVEMAIRIQRLHRSKIARKKLFILRTKMKYRIEARVTMGKDIQTFTPDTLFETLKQHQSLWVFVLLTFPWQPVDATQKRIFHTVATNWTYLRKEKFVFGVANAVDTVPFSTIEDGESVEDQNSPIRYSLLSWLGIQPDQMPCIVGFWQGRGPVHLGAAVLESPTGRFKKVCEGTIIPMEYNLSPTTVISQVMAWIETLQTTSRDCTATDLQARARGFLCRRRVKRMRIIRNEQRAMYIRRWIDMLRLKWHIRKTNRAALKIQRWVRGGWKRREFWIRWQEEMGSYRHAARIVQRALRRVFTIKYLHAALVTLLASPSRYPNSPLCDECFNVHGESHTLTLARLKCRDCAQAFCTSCFLKTHQSSKRMQHLSDTIDSVAMNDESTTVCGVCEVAAYRKRCYTCDQAPRNGVSNAWFCNPCFELHHTDHRIRSEQERRPSWWQSTAFQTHQWIRDSTPMDDQSTSVQTAAMVMAKYRWMSLAVYTRQQDQQELTEQARRDRDSRLVAVRMQQEAILRDAFDRYDKDQSGSIDETEFRRMFLEELCQPLSEQQVKDAMRIMDKSGNGLIEFDELLAWFAEDLLDNSGQESAGSASLTLFKETLKAKRQMRRYKEKLNSLMPTVPKALLGGGGAKSPPPLAEKPKVPGFPSIDCLDRADFAHKRNVFFRFLQQICDVEWIHEDEHIIPIANAMDVFERVFLPRWNAGQLTYDFYFDEESFTFEGLQWQRRWDAASSKYRFHTRRKRVIQQVEPVATAQKGRRRSSSKKRKKAEENIALSQVLEKEEEDEEVVEIIDPRRKQMLWDEAQRAFTKADQDASGFIDAEEFHRMLVAELCEPISKAQARKIMKELDSDSSGKIDFNEFFVWYATDKCQDYPTTAKLERARALLKTKRRARETANAAIGATVSGGLKVKEALEASLRAQQLQRDMKDASEQLIMLLQEGFAKALASKALILHQQDVGLARAWLLAKQTEERENMEREAQQGRERRANEKQARQVAAVKRSQRLAAMRRHWKALLLGPDKKEAHAANMADALENLDREIARVENEVDARTPSR